MVDIIEEQTKTCSVSRPLGDSDGRDETGRNVLSHFSKTFYPLNFYMLFPLDVRLRNWVPWESGRH